MLPDGFSGVELAERAGTRWPHLKILHMSGYAQDAIIGQGRFLNGGELLEKPFTMAVLSEKIRKVLDTA